MPDLKIRRADREDAQFLVPLIDRATEGLAKHMWAELAAPGQDAWGFALDRVQGEEAGISYTKAWVAETEAGRSGCLITHGIPDHPEKIDDATPAAFRPLLELEHEAPGTGYIFVLSILADQRGQGIGSALLGFAEQFRGPNGMSLVVADNNTRARALYECMGYRASATRAMVKNGWQSDGTRWVLMIKE